jgi:hypothetical protein
VFSITKDAHLPDRTANNPPADFFPPLPPPEPDSGLFGMDLNINMTTIDDFLCRPDVAYFDVRMFFDPADFPAIGGISNLTRALPGYRVVPFPFIATLSAMPVDGAYEGDKLFEVVWSEDREILKVTPNYLESETILSELFPKDKKIFLMCGGGGYSFLIRSLLIHQGWDENMIYHTGGNWHYEGTKALNMIVNPEDADDDLILATWRVNYAFIDFDRLHRIVP